MYQKIALEDSCKTKHNSNFSICSSLPDKIIKSTGVSFMNFLILCREWSLRSIGPNPLTLKSMANLHWLIRAGSDSCRTWRHLQHHIVETFIFTALLVIDMQNIHNIIINHIQAQKARITPRFLNSSVPFPYRKVNT